MQEAGTDDSRHPGPGLACAPEELHVVAPDEEVLARQSDSLDELSGDQDAVERDHHVSDEPVAGHTLDL